MAQKAIEPQLGLESYNCPHCGALAHQTWFHVYLERYDRDKRPELFQLDKSLFNKVLNQHEEDQDERKKWVEFYERSQKHLVFDDYARFGKSLSTYLINATISRCYSCSAFSVWIGDELVYPAHETAIIPHEDMPQLIAADFIEAANIVDKSPRGAAALLRLCVQKLVGHLGADASNLNAGIGELVQKGLDVQVKQALDIVRVVGNGAVHPGQIDLNDNKGTALQLFQLVNIIVVSTITAKKQIAELYGSLPPGAIEAIEKRDREK